jgi:hypothetical protein
MQIYDENIVVIIGFLCIVCFYTTPCIYFILYAETVFLLLLRFITLSCIRCFMMKLYFYASFVFYIIVYLTFYDDIVFSQILRFFTLLYLCFMICNIVVFYFFQFCLSTMYFLDHYFYVCILSSKYSAVFLYAVRFLLGVIVFIFSFHF